MKILFVPNYVNPSHIGFKSIRDQDASIGLLVILQNRDEGSADCKTGTIQGVNQFDLFSLLAPEAD